MLLVASDFDGTLFVKDELIIKKNIEYIKKLRSKGNLFVIITGRGISIRKHIKNYDIPYDYLMCENGAMVYDKEDNLLFNTYLEDKDINEVIKIINRDNLKFIFDDGEREITDLNDKYNNLACIFIKREGVLNLDSLMNELSYKTNTYNYISSNWINIVNKSINKKESLKRLSEYLDEKVEIHTIGDAINDIEMISSYNGGIMKEHDDNLNKLKNKNYETLADYLKELI